MHDPNILVFTKSSGWQHSVVKQTRNRPSIVESVLQNLGRKHGFNILVTKDGRIFDSAELNYFSSVLFYTTGNLTQHGLDKAPPMTTSGKDILLQKIYDGVLNFVGVHSATDTFHTEPDPLDRSNRYRLHGNQSDPYLKMLGGEFIAHSFEPRFQRAIVRSHPTTFPGFDTLPLRFKWNDEWYSLKEFQPDLHVLLTLETRGLKGESYQRAPYPITWARMHGLGRVFYTALGDRPSTWANPFFQDHLLHAIEWSLRRFDVSLVPNLVEAAPHYAQLPPKQKKYWVAITKQWVYSGPEATLEAK